MKAREGRELESRSELEKIMHIMRGKNGSEDKKEREEGKIRRKWDTERIKRTNIRMET